MYVCLNLRIRQVVLEFSYVNIPLMIMEVCVVTENIILNFIMFGGEIKGATNQLIDNIDDCRRQGTYITVSWIVRDMLGLRGQYQYI